MMWTRDGVCDRDAEIRKLARFNINDPGLRAHTANCDACRETLAIAGWMQTLAELPIEGQPLSDVHYLWWRAQVLRRWDAERKAHALIDSGERVQVGIGLVGAIVLLAWLWRAWQPSATSATMPFGLTVVMIASGVLLAITTVAAAHQLMARE